MARVHAGDKGRAPKTYMEWLECLDLMQKAPRNIAELEMLLRAGSFNGSKTVLSSLEQQIMNTINAILTKAVERLSATVNVCFEDNSYYAMIQDYKVFKRTVLATLFFEDLPFLPKQFREDLKESISAQMVEFDRTFKEELKNAAIDNPGTEFESAVTMINYIRLFD